MRVASIACFITSISIVVSALPGSSFRTACYVLPRFCAAMSPIKTISEKHHASLIFRSCSFSLARILVSGAGAGRIVNQWALLIGGLTPCLADMGLVSAAPPVLKSEALHILAHAVRGSEMNQECISKLVLNPLLASSPLLRQDPSHADRDAGFGELISAMRRRKM